MPVHATLRQGKCTGGPLPRGTGEGGEMTLCMKHQWHRLGADCPDCEEIGKLEEQLRSSELQIKRLKNCIAILSERPVPTADTGPATVLHNLFVALAAERNAARADLGRAVEALHTVDRLRKRLPDPDFGEQTTTVRAIAETIHEALTPSALSAGEEVKRLRRIETAARAVMEDVRVNKT